MLRQHGVEDLALEETKEHIIKMGKWLQATTQTVQDKFFIPVLVCICKKAREPLTNPFAWLLRYIDGDERQPSRLAILVWSKADEAAAELEELTKSEVWVDELAYSREGHPDSASERVHHEPRAPPPRRLRYVRLVMICKRGPAVRCPARLNVVRSLLTEDKTFLEITTLNFKSMFHTKEVVLEQDDRGRHTSWCTIFLQVQLRTSGLSGTRL